MKLFILMGQRRQRYEGQYGLEALACASEYDYDENPDYLSDTLKKYSDDDEFEKVMIVCLSVNEEAIRSILYPPAIRPIPAIVNAPSPAKNAQ